MRLHVTVVMIIVLAAALGIADRACASGFRLPDRGAAALGMAGAFAGEADDASAVWYNPAGIVNLGGTQVSAGITGIYPVLTHDAAGNGTETTKHELHLLPHLYATTLLTQDLAFGVGVNSPFGLSSDWGPDSSLRYLATFSRVTTVEVNPVVAYRISDKLSAAAGAAYVQLDATLEKLLPLADANFRLSGDGSGWGFNAALLYRAADSISLGLTYRSRVKVDINGTADVGSPFNISNSASTAITLPDLLEAGISYSATPRLTLNADLDYTFWSTYDRIVITSDTILALSGGTSDTQTIEKQWKDVWCLRIGGQYRLTDEWKIRAGYVYDRNPVPDGTFDAAVPDADRQGFTIGTGFSDGPVGIDFAYMYLRFNDRSISDSSADDATLSPSALNGTYRSLAHVAGITITYRF